MTADQDGTLGAACLGPAHSTAACSDTIESETTRSVEPSPPTDYFPIVRENRWHYDVEVSRPGGGVRRLTAVKRFTDSVEVAGKQYVRLVTDVSDRTLRVPHQLVRAGEKGVYAAVQGAEGQELLVLPADPRTLRSWGGEALPAIPSFAGEATVDETVEHGSSKYDRCVKVTLRMTIRERSFLGGTNDVPVRIERWFAPGMGMVRELRIVGEEGKPNYLRTDCKLTRLEPGNRP